MTTARKGKSKTNDYVKEYNIEKIEWARTKQAGYLMTWIMTMVVLSMQVDR